MYVESLCSLDSTMLFKIDEGKREIQALREHILRLTNDVEEKNRLLNFARSEIQSRENIVQQSREVLVTTDSLRGELSTLREEYSTMQFDHEERIRNFTAIESQSAEDRIQVELDLWILIESEKEQNEEKFKLIQGQLNRTKATLRRREAKIGKLIRTPFGYRSIVRPRKDLCDLAPGGGQAKRTMRLARAIIAPTTLTKICSQNSETGSRRRLCGSHEKQAETGKVLANMLSVNEVSAICKTTRMNKVGVGIANEYMDKIGESIGPHEIVETMDYNGITQNGYAAVYKRFQSAVKVSNRGLRIGCLPRPFRVSKTRQMLNLKLAEFIGDYYSLTESNTFPLPTKSKEKDFVIVSLNQYNNICADVEQVQRTMVELYGITVEGMYHNLNSIVCIIALNEFMFTFKSLY